MKKPTLDKRVCVIQGDAADKWLFLRPDVPDWVVTNDAGASILTRCDGCKSIQNILETTGICKTDVVDFVQHIDDASHLFESKNSHCQSFDSSVANHPHLRSVHFNLTQNCNLDCTYCYATDRPEISSTLTFDKWKNILRDIAELTGRRVTITFTGGEPLLVSFCLDLAAYSKELGNSNHLLTNGMAITEKNIGRITQSFDVVRISLDGNDKQTHEAHRGKKTFDKTMHAIDLLEREGASYMVSMTVTQKNLTNVDAMSERFGSRLSFQPLFRAGNATDAVGLSITGEQYYESLASVKKIKPLGTLEKTLARAKQRRNRKCAIGDTEISIAPNGDVFPCHMLHQPDLLAGNLLTDKLANIYLNSPVLKQCRNLTVENIEECNECPIRYICGGSCRARAYFETGSLRKAGDFCSYEKLAYIEGIFDSSSFD